MKKLHFLFVFIFLASMLLTVFQYMPSLQEETPSHRVELAKKSNADDTDGPDTDSDPEDMLTSFFQAQFSSFATGINLFANNNNLLYQHQPGNILTPPPKA